MLFWFGLAAGVLLTIPLVAVAARHTARRVRRLEQLARTSERLAELGTLTGGLAHEIKNPLSTVGLNAQLIQEDLAELAAREDQSEASREHLGRIERRFETLARETQRLRHTLDDFLRYAGRVRLDRVPTDLNALVDELADFFEPQAAAAKIQLRSQLAAVPATVPADSGLLKQALLNLMINAVQAMSQARGELDASRHGGCDELILRTERRRAPGAPAVDIHIIDTGPGLRTDVAEKIFQPYFSTKANGSGLGLSTARRIVEEHGGTIAVNSEEGRGCEFVVTIPEGGEAGEEGMTSES